MTYIAKRYIPRHKKASCYPVKELFSRELAAGGGDVITE